jgi:hypothetical protein
MAGVYPAGVEVQRHAAISGDGLFRYALHRSWGDGDRLMFIMLNPSTADADQDDPTIRRCVGFARTLGFDGIGVFNLYAWRATEPAALWVSERIGRDISGGERNDDLLRELLRQYARRGAVVAAWGAHAKQDRINQILAFRHAEHLRCLGTTKAGAPRHPLYLPATARPEPWVPPTKD